MFWSFIYLTRRALQITQIEFNITLKKTARQIREQLAVAFKNALHLACSPTNIKASFAKTWIYTLDIKRFIENNFTLSRFPNQLSAQIFISSKWEKSTEMLNSLFIKEFDWIKEPDEYFDIEQVINAVKKDELN